jgi:hypothetical protein
VPSPEVERLGAERRGHRVNVRERLRTFASEIEPAGEPGVGRARLKLFDCRSFQGRSFAIEREDSESGGENARTQQLGVDVGSLE